MAKLIVLITVIVVISPYTSTLRCQIPPVIRGLWFSWENGEAVETLIDEQSMTGKGYCVDLKEEYYVNYTFVFRQETEDCYRCVKLLVRTINVLQKMETPCVAVPLGEESSVENVCKNIMDDQYLITLFDENHVPVNCRSSLEGAWQFGYQNDFRFIGDCNHSEAVISACPTTISQLLTANKRFNITYRMCAAINGIFDGVVEYTCLGDWFVGRKHFFAVANAKEPRKADKYRCFLRNLGDDRHIGASVTAECNTLKTVEESPERLHLTPVNSEIVVPHCTLPQNFSGEWIDPSNLDSDISINATHIVQTSSPGEGQFQQIAHVCHRKEGTYYIMARHTFDGCKKSYVCYEFVSEHLNVIRYQRGSAYSTDDIDVVCSREQYKNRKGHKYDLYLAKNPIPVQCPIAGRFNFTQQGDVLFEHQIPQGIFLSIRPNVYCKRNISDFSVCGSGQKEILIDVSHCLPVDRFGRPVDIFSDPDYSLNCIGFWEENLKSYLITYSERDAFNKYHCWVYQRTDLNTILMSQALGSVCDLKQSATSSNYTEGAAVALELHEYEIELQHCPFHFDDGSTPSVHSVNITMLNITMPNITISNVTTELKPNV